MKVEDRHKDIGFQAPSEGWHVFEITDRSNWRPGQEQDTVTDTMSMHCKVISGSNEVDESEGRSTFLSCPLDKPFGRTLYATLIGLTGADKVLEKNNSKINGNLSADKWGEKYLNPDKSACTKVINEARLQLIGRTFKGKVENVEVKGKDEKGAETSRTFANIVKLEEVDAKDAVAPGSAEPETASEQTVEDFDSFD